MQNENESMSYETILSLLGEDYKKAFSVYSILSKTVDMSYPLPSFASTLASMVGVREEDLDSLWRRVRDSYQKIRGSYEIIDQNSPFFPSSLLSSEYPVPFLYALGNLRLLEKERMTVIGGLSPSKEAIAIAEEASSFLKENRVVLLTPLRLGISSIMIADMIKDSGNVIAFSSSFVTKAPNERLRDQMIDIYRRGGLLLSASGPARRDDKWHQVIRNRALSCLSSSIFLIEEKDGGPAWKIFDGAYEAKKMISLHQRGRDGYSFISERLDEGVLAYGDVRDLKKILQKKERRERVKVDLSLTPDLF